jgi:hypothetical protein
VRKELLRNVTLEARRDERFARAGVLLVLLPLLVACSSGHTAGGEAPSEPIRECDSYLAAYEHCLNSLGHERVTEARVEQRRAAFAAQAALGGSARQALRKQCTDGLSQIKTMCR